MKSVQPFKMSDNDIKAILQALPIAENYPTDSPSQMLINRFSCQGVRQKLLSGRKDFSQNELRVIAFAVCSAAEFLSGRMPELAELMPDVSVIRQYTLSYVRLSSYFRPQIETLNK